LVGIGTTSPTTTLDVNGTTFITGSLGVTGSVSITSNGKFVMGTNTPDTVLTSAGDIFQILSTSATFGYIGRYSNNANGARFGFFKSRATTVGGRGAVQADDNLGRLVWYADNGGAIGDEAAAIWAQNVGEWEQMQNLYLFSSGFVVVTMDSTGQQVSGSLLSYWLITIDGFCSCFWLNSCYRRCYFFLYDASFSKY
jgi:hypothetical protein